jgi:uncharacterized protein involved in exopolysaccharide biosynthesis
MNDKAETLSLRDILEPLFRYKRVLIVTFVCVFAFATLAGFLWFYKYESHMALLVSRQRMDPVVTTNAPSQLTDSVTPINDEDVNSEVELLQSRDILEQVVLANGLDNPKHLSFIERLLPQKSSADRVAAAVKDLARHLKVEAVEQANVIDVKYRSNDPELAYSVLKSLGSVYLRRDASIHRPSGSYAFFQEEALRYKKALYDSEATLRSLGEQKRIAGPDDERTDLALQVADFTGQLHMAQQSIAADEERILSDEQQMRSTPQRSPTQQASNAADLLLQSLGQALLAAELKRTQLSLKYEPSYPLVREADEEVAQAKSAIEQAEKTQYVNQTTDRDPTFELLREDLAKTRTDLAGQRANDKAIQASIQNMQSKMIDLDKESLEEADVRREVKANEDNYLLYESKQEQERAADALNSTTSIGNVSIAVPPAIPALRMLSPVLILFCAMAVAMFFSVGAAYGASYFDSTFHNPAQVANELDIPIVINVARKVA